MNTIHDHVGNEDKIICYADDIAIWHSLTDITISGNILNIHLSRTEDWAKQLILLINPDTSKFCVFFIDRRKRATFHPNLKINNAIIEKHPKNLGLTLTAELRFTNHTENISQKALKEFSAVRKLFGSNWGSKPKTLLNTYTALIGEILGCATLMWAPCSSTWKGTIDSVQHRASKFIIGAVSSTGNEKAGHEWGLLSLANKRKLVTIKFTNKIRSCHEQHISNITFRVWTAKNRLKRSSTLQFDNDIRNDINMKHTCLDIFQEAFFPVKPLSSVKIILDLLGSCKKK